MPLHSHISVSSALKYHNTAIRHIIWDWNGTLLNDAALCATAVDVMMRKRGIGSESLLEYKQKIQFPVKDYYKKLGFDLSAENYDRLCDEFADEYAESEIYFKLATGKGSLLHADVMQILNELSESGVTHSIVSASEEELLKRQIAEAGISNHFTNVVGRSDNHGGVKGHLLQDWVKKCGYHRNNILYIGDTIHDHEVALESGIRVVLVSDGHVSKERLLQCSVPIFDNRMDLLIKLMPLTRSPVSRFIEFDSPIGQMGVVTDNLGINRVLLPESDHMEAVHNIYHEPDELTLQAKLLVLNWFDNPYEEKFFPLSVLGTPFQHKVWRVTMGIPAGETTSYKGISLKIGQPNAYRAVAMALRANPVPILVPCHRVIGSNGTPTGYMGKRDNPMQKKILSFEE